MAIVVHSLSSSQQINLLQHNISDIVKNSMENGSIWVQKIYLLKWDNFQEPPSRWEKKTALWEKKPQAISFHGLFFSWKWMTKEIR